MITCAIVAGKYTSSIVDSLDAKKLKVCEHFDSINELWDDILQRGNAPYLDIDKILILQQGFMSENEMAYIDQIQNIQSVLAMVELRADLHIITSSSNLSQSIREMSIDPDLKDDILIYNNFNLLVFESINVMTVSRVLEGEYDARGIYHPNFLRKDEIEAQLTDAYEEAEIEFTPISRESTRPNENIYNDNEEQERLIAQRKREAEETAKQRQHEEREQQRIAAEEAKRAKQSQSKLPRQEMTENDLPPAPKKSGGLFGRSSKQKKPPKSQKAPKPTRKKNTPTRVDDAVDVEGIIAFTGSRQSGVSTTLANSAVALARLGKNVLVVDLDFERRFQSLFFKQFENDVLVDSRVGNGLLVSLANPKNLEDVVAIVDNNLSVLGISQEVNRPIEKFANRPFETLFSSTNIVTLLSFAKSLYDVVLIDYPFHLLEKIGNSLSFVDRIVLCNPNSIHSIDSFFEVDLEHILLTNDLVAHTLISKAQLLLTKYNRYAEIDKKEATPERVQNMLFAIDDPIYHLEVLGLIPFVFEYEQQYATNKPIVLADDDMRDYFLSFLNNIT